MSLLSIRCYPDPVLREVSKPIQIFDDQLRKFLADLKETMYAAQGIGLAAPQVGVLSRAVVIDISREAASSVFLINPEILSFENEVPSEEGCLSIPEYRDTIQRFNHIRVRAQNEVGEQREFDAEGLFAICIQHEIDHLNGILFVDKLSRLKRDIFRRWCLKRQNAE